MKRFTRSLLITLVALLVVVGGVYAYLALTGTVRLTIQEPLSFVGPNAADVALYPQEQTQATFTVANASSVALDVDLTYSITPDPTGKGIVVQIPNKITAPAGGQVAVTVTITASKSAAPGAYTITILFGR